MGRLLARWLNRPSAADAAESATEALEGNTALIQRLTEAFRSLSQSVATVRPDHR